MCNKFTLLSFTYVFIFISVVNCDSEEVKDFLSEGNSISNTTEPAWIPKFASVWCCTRDTLKYLSRVISNTIGFFYC